MLLDFAWQFQKFKTNVPSNRATNPKIANVRKSFGKKPTGKNSDLFDEHSGFNSMRTEKLELGAFNVILDKFESDFKEAVKEELIDFDTQLQ